MDKKLLVSYSDRIKSLGHPIRLHIALMLVERSYSVNEICRNLHIPQATISQHLAILRGKGIIVGDRKGTTINYGLASDSIKDRLTSIRKSINDASNSSNHLSDSTDVVMGFETNTNEA